MGAGGAARRDRDASEPGLTRPALAEPGMTPAGLMGGTPSARLVTAALDPVDPPRKASTP
jgi:hypothetical protein